MANTASAKKRARQNETRRRLNNNHRSKLKTSVRKVRLAIAANDKEAASAAYKLAVPTIDSMVNKGLIHKNRAAHYKNKLNAYICAL